MYGTRRAVDLSSCATGHMKIPFYTQLYQQKDARMNHSFNYSGGGGRGQRAAMFVAAACASQYRRVRIIVSAGASRAAVQHVRCLQRVLARVRRRQRIGCVLGACES